ncbi:MAG TPA: PEP-CTERM sorting domain-containing protein [Bryobacteraceae bacterium]|nr:PEP-CTERM sorting domain-containing protein [Bryobacteraceae bacterium]
MRSEYIHAWRFALALGLFCATANAGNILFTFGGSGLGGPQANLNSMNPPSAATVTDVNPLVGDGNTSFDGGLVFANNLLYGIGNDGGLFSTLYSFDLNGNNVTAVSTDFNTTGQAQSFIFQNGLASDGTNFYAIGVSTLTGAEDLFQIGDGNATLLRSLPTFGGTYAGMAWDAALAQFYALLVNGTGDQAGDRVVHFGLSTGWASNVELTHLDGAQVGSHLDGLADTGTGILYDIYMNQNTNTGQLEEIDLRSTPTVTTLYDTAIQGSQTAGIAIVTPEPATTIAIGAGLCVLASMLKRRMK